MHSFMHSHSKRKNENWSFVHASTHSLKIKTKKIKSRFLCIHFNQKKEKQVENRTLFIHTCVFIQ